MNATVLALGYFAVPNTTLPPSLYQVPLEYFQQAALQLLATPGVHGGLPLALVGTSRGGEAVLQAVARLPKLASAVSSAVALVGSGVALADGWSLGGAPLPTVPLDATCGATAAATLRPDEVAVATLDCALTAQPAAAAAATAPLGTYAGQLLLISAGADRVWNSLLLLQYAVNAYYNPAWRGWSVPRLQWHVYYGAGHGLVPSFYEPTYFWTQPMHHPLLNVTTYLGGGVEANAWSGASYAANLLAALSA